MFIDTHCHLSIEDYDNIDSVIKDNLEAGVKKIIVSACNKRTLNAALDLSSKYDCVYVTLGYHPEEASLVTNEDLEILKKLLKTFKVVGVGEIGLDYHYGKENIELQKQLFEKQLSIAEELKLPVVIHSRDAVSDTINILKKYKVIGVIHCFSGSFETASIYIKMGFKLGIGGVVTFKNSNLYTVVSRVGIDNIVLETDAPYLTPEPYRGKQNSSKYIPIIAEKIAQILNISVEDVASHTTKTASDLFDL